MEPTLEEIGKAFHELKAAVASGMLDGDKRAKIDTVLNEYEKKNQQLVQTIELSKSQDIEIKELKANLEAKGVEAGKIREQVDKLTLAIAKSNSGGNREDFKLTAEYKRMDAYIRSGGDIAAMDVETKATLRTDAATEGGVLVVNEYENSILKRITEIDPVRSVARVRPISSKSIVMPTRTGIPTALYEGEMETSPESISSYGSETITVFRLTHTVPITRDLLMDAAFDMEREIMLDAAEAFAYGEGNGFVAGTGFKAPEGFTKNAAVVAAALASSTTGGLVTAKDPILLQGQLKVGYNGIYMLNRTTLANIRTIQGTANDHFIWQPGLGGGNPATLAGAPYVLSPSMQNEGHNNYPLAFGDFRVGYTIVDRTAVEVIRDEYTNKKKAVIEFTVHRWNNGKVVMPEAIKLLRTRTS